MGAGRVAVLFQRLPYGFRQAVEAQLNDVRGRLGGADLYGGGGRAVVVDGLRRVFSILRA